MAKRMAQGQSAGDVYEGVLGYLSADAQAALFKYLPELDARVDKEVQRFGEQLGRDLTALVQTECALACERIQTAMKGADDFNRFVEEEQQRVDGLEGWAERTAEAAGGLAEMASETCALHGRVRAFAKHAAEFPTRRTTEGLLWALEDLKQAHQNWRTVAGRLDHAIARAAEPPSEKAPAEQGDLGEIHNVIRQLASCVQSLSPQPPAGDETVAPPPEDDADQSPASPFSQAAEGDVARPPQDASDAGHVDPGKDGPGEDDPGDDAPASGPASEVKPPTLAQLIWDLLARLQEAQRRRTEALAVAEKKLQQKAAQAVRDTAQWRSQFEGLSGRARALEDVAADLPKRINTALKHGIGAAKLDIRGSANQHAEGRR